MNGSERTLSSARAAKDSGRCGGPGSEQDGHLHSATPGPLCKAHAAATCRGRWTWPPWQEAGTVARGAGRRAKDCGQWPGEARGAASMGRPRALSPRAEPAAAGGGSARADTRGQQMPPTREARGGTDTSGSGCHGGGGWSREPQASARRAGPMPGAPSAQAHSRLSSIAVGAKPLGDPRGGARARHARGRPQSAARQTGTEAYDSHGWRGHFA